MKSSFSGYLLVAFFLLTSISLTAQISSTFTGNAQGWTTPDDADGTIAYSATGGNPGGYVFGTPFPINLGMGTFYVPFYFVSPGTYGGNRSGYFDGTLRFDLQQTTTAASEQAAEVILTNNAGVSVYYFPPAPFQPPASPTWTTYSVVLNEDLGYWKTSNSASGTAATGAQILNILTSLETIEIRGRFRNANVQGRLDNVTFTPPIIINTQPAVTTFVCPGTPVTLTTAASGNPSISYQWQILSGSVYVNINNGGNYSGVTTSTLSITTTDGTATGNYRCAISGSNVENAYTNNASVSIGTRPSPPTTTGASSCTPAALTLTASGLINGQYRWYALPTAGVMVSSAASYTTPVLTTTTTYYVAIFDGSCESTRTPVIAEIAPPSCTNHAPEIEVAPITTQIGSTVTLNLVDLITDSDDNIDLSTLTIVTPPASGAAARIDNEYNLVVDYTGISFSGTESIAIRVCDIYAACTTQTFSIDVVGEIEIFNGLSANGDQKNPIFRINHIQSLDDTRLNHVSIYNRWGDVVWEGTNYDNDAVAFTGKSKNNDDLPAGTYFYKIEFTSGHKQETGYLVLKR